MTSSGRQHGGDWVTDPAQPAAGLGPQPAPRRPLRSGAAAPGPQRAAALLRRPVPFERGPAPAPVPARRLKVGQRVRRVPAWWSCRSSPFLWTFSAAVGTRRCWAGLTPDIRPAPCPHDATPSRQNSAGWHAPKLHRWFAPRRPVSDKPAGAAYPAPLHYLEP
jgi:hypothetical protein